MRGLFGSELHTDIFVVTEHLGRTDVTLLAEMLGTPLARVRAAVMDLRNAGVMATVHTLGDSMYVEINEHQFAAEEIHNLARKIGTLPRYARQWPSLEQQHRRYAAGTQRPATPARSTTPRKKATGTKKGTPVKARAKRKSQPRRRKRQ